MTLVTTRWRLALELTDTAYRFEPITPKGLVLHDILDQPQVYPGLAVKLSANAMPGA
jgi:hypothetical protein